MYVTENPVLGFFRRKAKEGMGTASSRYIGDKNSQEMLKQPQETSRASPVEAGTNPEEEVGRHRNESLVIGISLHDLIFIDF